jgi:hypothetical protein
MMERIFGIMRRAYYLTAISIFAGCMLGYFFGNWGADPARMSVLVVGLVTPIIAVVAHKILHWIIWGKLK